MSGRRARKERREPGFNKATVKGLLAQHGQSLHPEATMTFVERPTGPASVIVLDRVSDFAKGAVPEYCTHGYAECVACAEMCFLGHATEGVVVSGEALPICKQCAIRNVPPDTKPVTRYEDHLRKDGPH